MIHPQLIIDIASREVDKCHYLLTHIAESKMLFELPMCLDSMAEQRGLERRFIELSKWVQMATDDNEKYERSVK